MKKLLLITLLLGFSTPSAFKHFDEVEYFEPMKPVREGIILTRKDSLIRLVLQEASGENLHGQILVAGVVLDRVRDSRFPNTENSVSRQKGQFEGMWKKFGNYSQEQIQQANLAVEVAKQGFRPCGRVLFFKAIWLKSDSWWEKRTKVCRVGGHDFYK